MGGANASPIKGKGMYDRVLMYLDRIFISFYRLVGDPILAYFLGTFILALLCVLIGELLVGLAVYVNRDHLRRLTDELIRWNNLAVEAVEKGNPDAYHTFNREANEVYGKLFFLSIAHSAACLVPIPFVLAWMQMRFGDVQFPLPFSLPGIGNTVNYIFTFVVLYLPAWWFFKKVKRYLPLYGRIEILLEESGRAVKEMKSLADVLEKKMKASAQEV